MNKLVLSYYTDLPFPSSAAATRQMAKTVEGLQLVGADARLYLPIPWKFRRLDAQTRLDQLRAYYGLWEHFKVREIPSPLPLFNKIQRFPFTYRCLPIIEHAGTDVLCVRNFWHLKLALSRGMTVLYETYKYKSQARRSQAIIELLNENQRFIGAIMHSKLARDYWISQGAHPEKITTIHNGIDAAEIAATPGLDRVPSRRELQLPETARIVSYIGNMGRTKGIEAVIELARYLPEVLFLLVGLKENKDRIRLKKVATRLGAHNIEMRPWIPPSQVGPFLRASDAVIIPPTAKPLLEAGQTVFPIKTFGYLACGVPLLAPRLEDTAEVLKHEENAFLLEPDAPKKNAHAIKELIEDPVRMEQIARNALEQAHGFTWEKRAEKILAFATQRFGQRAGPNLNDSGPLQK